MDRKLKVGVLGATGMVGQRFLSLLENHPWYEVVVVAASPNSAGKRYEDAVGGRWKMTTPMPKAYKDLIVMNVNDVDAVAKEVDFVFSAVDMTKDEIKAIEEAYAKTETPVVSNNSAHRWTKDVPMVVPEINPEHFEIIESQKKRLGTKRGFIAVKPNCSIQSYAPVLNAWKEFEPEEVVVTTYQAISGAGKTFKDYIVDYQSRAQNDSIHEVAQHFGLDESLLREMVNLHLTLGNINEYNRFDKLVASVDLEKAKRFFEQETGTEMNNFEVNLELDEYLRKFLVEG